MNPLCITLMADGSLFDIDSFGQSLCELLPTIYKVDVGKTSYSLNEEGNEFLKKYSNATDVTIHLLLYKNDIITEKLEI